MRKIFLGLACVLALSGCVKSNGRENTVCYGGVTYIKSGNSYKSGITVAVDRDGKPLPCKE